jgi:hypothetical protein
MEALIKDAPPKFKYNYHLFKLDPIEKEIMKDLKTKKRNFLNPVDPFFTKYRDHYKLQHNQLLETDQVYNIISPRNHNMLIRSNKD